MFSEALREERETNVVRISTASIIDAAIKLGRDPAVDSVFISCTNLRTAQAIPQISDVIKKPVFSSNYCLAWHLKSLISA